MRPFHLEATFFAMGNQFRHWAPKTARIPSQEWETHKVELRRMRTEGIPMKVMLAVLEEKYGFVAK